MGSKPSSIAMLLLITGLCGGSTALTQQSGTEAELQQLRSQLKQISARIDAIEAMEREKGVAPAVASDSANTAVAAANPAEAHPGNALAGSASEATPLSPQPVARQRAAPPTEQQTAPIGSEAIKEAQDQGVDTMDAGMGGDQMQLPFLPAMKFRGFGDVRLSLANQNLGVIYSNPGAPTTATQGGNSTFTLGVLDLFVTSKISDHFSYLAELGFQADNYTNNISVDTERAQLSFTANDYFSVSAGRTHAMLGYYNAAYHHGTWFQTTIDRPLIYEFEDSGGPLPIHNVGVAAMGKIPSGSLGLHWIAEVGNGKQTYSLQATVTPANVLADHTGKSTNFGMYVKPDWWNGFQTGFDWYQASVVPVTALLPGYGEPNFPFPGAVDYYHQNIYIAHAIYIQPHFEFLAEDVEIRDLPRSSNKPLYTSGGYAQISRAWGVWRPYFRYEWLNPNFRDPNNAWVGRWVGPRAGVRWDLNPFVALKLEYANSDWKNFSLDRNGNQVLPVLHKTIDQVKTQLTYTF